MSYIGGTPEVQNFIKKYTKSGHIVDPYTNHWLNQKILPSNNKINNLDKNLYKGFDKKFGQKYRGHLLILHVDHDQPKLIDDLKKIYKPFNFIFTEVSTWSDMPMHSPDFILINLAIHKVLCLGLGRKNSIFGYDLEEYYFGKQNTVNLNNVIDCKILADTYMGRFTLEDHAGYTSIIIRALHNLSLGFCSFDSLPVHPYEWPDEPEISGEYLLDGNLVAADEFADLESTLLEAEKNINNGKDDLMLFYPNIHLNIGSLNTGDY